jgi:hypothetical protein
MTTKFLIPKEGLLIRDPGNFNPLPETGELKPWIGKEGRYWRRRVNDGTVTIGVPKKIKTGKKK